MVKGVDSRLCLAISGDGRCLIRRMSQKSLEMGRPLELVKESGCRKRSALTVGSPGGDWSREGTADDFATIPSTMNHHQEMMHRRSLFPSARQPRGAKKTTGEIPQEDCGGGLRLQQQRGPERFKEARQEVPDQRKW